jgi:UDP-N-acetylglucosamine 2-epimerase (non-hydrolysing)
MKILTVFGTRPEAIKMAILVKELNIMEGVNHKLCVTGQHRQMLDQVLSFFEIIPDYDLNIMQKGQDLYDITSRVLIEMRAVLSDFMPDLVLVHGDTTTCFATSLAAFYAGIKVGHVEAGLRTGNLLAPFPEEANRSLVGRIASYHFAPTTTNVENLLKEGITENVFKTGNTVIDALLFAKDKVISFSSEINDQKLIDVFSGETRIILVTGHRRENLGEGFLAICRAIKRIAREYPKIHIVYPVHLNPKVQAPVIEILSDLPNVHLIAPLNYPDFVYAMKQSYFILTDSGGVQEEAPSLGKPVLVMRDTTERPEAVDAGTVKLVGANEENIYSGVKLLLDNKQEYEKMNQSINPYGDGLASKRIIKLIKNDK